jgi:hypothetical protein
VEIYLGKSALRAVSAARARNRPRAATALGETRPRSSDFGDARGVANAPAPAAEYGPAADASSLDPAQGGAAPLRRATRLERPRTTPRRTRRARLAFEGKLERGWDDSVNSGGAYDAVEDVHCNYTFGAAFASSPFDSERRSAAMRRDDLIRVPRVHHVPKWPVVQHHYKRYDVLPP